MRRPLLLRLFPAPREIPAPQAYPFVASPSGDPDSAYLGEGEGWPELVHADSFQWLSTRKAKSIHAVVTDPPYGVVEYSEAEVKKLRARSGGVWRNAPSFDGNQRAPLPRFSIITDSDVERIWKFFNFWAELLQPTLVPGAHVIVASNPLLTSVVGHAIWKAGFERRGQIARLVQTMRGGDRPKNAEEEFAQVSVMPRSMHEPWLVFRNPLEGRMQDNLRKWGTGGFRRISDDLPFGDVIRSSPTQKRERAIANHPSLKPQALMRQLVRAVLPTGKGTVLDTFAGSGSTLAAAEAVGYRSIGLERDTQYFDLAKAAIKPLSKYQVDTPWA